ncbi:MAG: FAD-dependent monooxygenase [Alphaproteobacteria bacterium]|jgi:2-octaprenyl-6-methoxyphenol hydroxylase|nr:FAD-dependent monooxygenase [Candidatus Jidaibacter sp.]
MKYDVLVIGGGPIGLLSALSLHKLGLNIAVLEAKKEDQYFSNLQALRLYAIAEGSLRIIQETCDILKNEFDGQPINKILVADRMTMRSLTFDPTTIGSADFGMMIDEGALQKTLYDKIVERKIPIIFGQSVDSIEESAVITSKKKRMQANLFIVTDGKKSVTRALMGFGVRKHKYDQIAFVADIELETPHKGLAVENFTPQGPFAILPKIGGNVSSIVWTMPKKFASTLQTLDESIVNALINDRASDIFGKIKLISSHAFFELELQEAKDAIHGRFVLLGDSLHAIHPIAGQGLNLSIRDLQMLYIAIKDGHSLGLDIGNNTLVQDAYKKRELDNKTMATATTVLNALFANNIPVIESIRSFGLSLVDESTIAKSIFMNYASGNI